jgi:hypothetical protein
LIQYRRYEFPDRDIDPVQPLQREQFETLYRRITDSAGAFDLDRLPPDAGSYPAVLSSISGSKSTKTQELFANMTDRPPVSCSKSSRQVTRMTKISTGVNLNINYFGEHRIGIDRAKKGRSLRDRSFVLPVETVPLSADDVLVGAMELARLALAVVFAGRVQIRMKDEAVRFVSALCSKPTASTVIATASS